MKIPDYSVTGKRVKKLVCVTADNNNKYYHMYEQTDNTFKVVYGRIQGSAVEHSYPIKDWDKIYRTKTKKGYEDITHLYTEEIEEQLNETDDVTKIADIQNSLVKQLIEDLQAYANKTIKENYTVSQSEVTQLQVDEAQSVINTIVTLIDNNTSCIELNEQFLKLYRIVPRRMANVKDHLVSCDNSDNYSIENVQKMIDSEQKLLDVMIGQVESIKKQKELSKSSEKTQNSKPANILDALGLTIDVAKDEEVNIIKKMMGPNAKQLKKAFRIINNKTEDVFNNHLKKSKNKTTEMFWHGSRNENWFNIIQSGLLIRPAGAITTGSLLGNAVYFANKAQKSIGYTSLSGSYWARGGSNKAYLAIYEVHVGNQKHIKDYDPSWNNLTYATIQMDNYDSVFAHGGSYLRNDEITIYNISQSTIRYLIEIGN